MILETNPEQSNSDKLSLFHQNLALLVLDSHKFESWNYRQFHSQVNSWFLQTLHLEYSFQNSTIRAWNRWKFQLISTQWNLQVTRFSTLYQTNEYETPRLKKDPWTDLWNWSIFYGLFTWIPDFHSRNYLLAIDLGFIKNCQFCFFVWFRKTSYCWKKERRKY